MNAMLLSNDVSIRGNEKAVVAAKSAPCHSAVLTKFKDTDLAPSVSKMIHERRQQFWNGCTGNRLY